MKEAFRLQTEFSSSFDRWVSSFVSNDPTPLQWTTLKEIIQEYTVLHTNQTLPKYIPSSITYYAKRISTPSHSEIIIYENISVY